MGISGEWNISDASAGAEELNHMEMICAMVYQLTKNLTGYITRNRIRNEKGHLREMEYTVYSSPKLNDNYGNNPIVENPTPDNPTLDFPTHGKPTQ